MNNEQIVNSIRMLCKNHNITVTKLEETLGMSQGLISRWAKSDPSLSKIIDIADYFEISIDDVTGYKSDINDKFIEKLISQTDSQNLKWQNYTNNNTTPKQYSGTFDTLDFVGKEEFDNYFNTHIEVSYYTCINNGYISIYGFYENNNIKAPLDIKLFIQPTDKSALVPQNYTKDQLIPLWLKILYALNEDAPDEIKAEELKNNFINSSTACSSFKDYKNADFSGVDFSGADFSNSNLSNVNLAYANLSGANLKGTIFTNKISNEKE